MAKRWHIVVEGLGVAFPSPETLEQHLTANVGGAIKVENIHDFEVHGPNNVYTVQADDALDTEIIKDLVDQSIRKYDPKNAEYTVVVTAAKD